MAGEDEQAAPTAERCHEFIKELAGTWNVSRDNARFATTLDLAFAPVLFAHVAHSVQLATAVSELHQSGHGLVVMPMVRQVIECSIRAVWLELYRGNVRAVLREGHRQRKNLLASAVKATWLDASDGLVRNADGSLEDDQATSGRNFERICAEIDGGDREYVLYRFASALTHPGTDLVEHYLESTDAAGSGIGFVTDPELGAADAWLGITAQHALMAVCAWDRAELGRPYRTDLRSWAVEFGVDRYRPGMTGIGFKAANRAETRRRRARKRQRRS
jgi:hypothetical protein